MPIRMASTTPTPIACTAATEAPSGSCSPMRRATVAVAAIARPMAMANTSTTTASVSPTAAMASGPRRATQKASTTPKVDSITISRMVGMASRAMPRVKLPCVKSCVVPLKRFAQELPLAAGRG